MRKTIWVTDEHLNLKGSLSAPSQSDGHPELKPENAFTCTNVLNIPSADSLCNIYVNARVGRLHIRYLMALHFPSDHRQPKKDGASS